MIRTVACVAAAALIAIAVPASASNYRFLFGEATADFKDSDFEMMKAAVDKALAAKQTGSTIDWKNDATGASGSVTPRRDFTKNALPCRELRVVNRSTKIESAGNFRYCRKDGRWGLAP